MGRVAVIHPDLGVGGAERLIVDASRALKESGHTVKIYTGYHDNKRCFQETCDGTLEIITIGSWIPRHIFGKFHALLAYIKMIYIAIHVLIYSKHDIVLCDQVSACIPALKYLNFRRPNVKIVFYCHFPDQLLTHRDSLLKALYRKPLDMLEEYSTGMADVILVNSKFTSSVVKRTFRSLYERDLTVLYPCVDVKYFLNFKRQLPKSGNNKMSQLVRKSLDDTKENFTFLSINRFETKKNLALAIKALKECILGFEINNQDGEDGTKEMMRVKLVIAGGYDDRLNDCIKYYCQLRDLTEDLNLTPYVSFIKSPSEEEKSLLLNSCHVVVYTPENEHFGIVPLEAMAMSKPIIASASGGPLETIENDVNGILCEPDKYAFAEAMLTLYSNRTQCERMGQAGFERVKRCFSYEAFRSKLDEICYPVH